MGGEKTHTHTQKTNFQILTSYSELGLLSVYKTEVRIEGSETGTNKAGKIHTSSLHQGKKGMRELKKKQSLTPCCIFKGKSLKEEELSDTFAVHTTQRGI